MRAAVRRKKLGWMTGLEPATPGATVQCSTIELHPPRVGAGVSQPYYHCAIRVANKWPRRRGLHAASSALTLLHRQILGMSTQDLCVPNLLSLHFAIDSLQARCDARVDGTESQEERVLANAHEVAPGADARPVGHDCGDDHPRHGCRRRAHTSGRARDSELRPLRDRPHPGHTDGFRSGRSQSRAQAGRTGDRFDGCSQRSSTRRQLSPRPTFRVRPAHTAHPSHTP